MHGEHTRTQLRFLHGRETGHPQQHDAERRSPEPDDQLPEIFVGGDQHRRVLPRQPENTVIIDRWHELCDVQNLVSIGAQSRDDRPVDALVGDERHGLDSTTG